MAVFTAIAAAVTAISSWTIGLGALGTFAVGNFLLRAAVQLGVSALAKAFAKKSDPIGSEPFSIQGNVRTGGSVPRSFGVGEYLTAGSLVWHSEWGHFLDTPNAYYTQVIALSDLPVSGLRRVFIDGQVVTLEDVGSETGLAAAEYRVDGRDHAWVKFYDGTQTEADSFLTGTVNAGSPRGYSASRVGVGIAYAIVTFRINQEIFAGFPRTKFVLDGVKMYDISKDSTQGGDGDHRWNDPSTWGGDGDRLPAVQAYNLARGLSFGGEWFYGLQGLTAARLPADHWIAQIEKCRAGIQGEQGLEPLYRCAGEITVNSEMGSAFEAILTSCAGRMSEVGGVFKIYVGAPDAPIAHFYDDDILSLAPQTFTPFFGLSDTINGVIASYPSPDEGYVMRSTPPLYNSQFENEDGGRRLMTDVQLSFVPYPAQAQRLLHGELAAARRARRHTHSLPAKFRLIEPGDVVEWSSARNGYQAKQFRVDGVIDLPNCDLIVDLTEVDPSDHGSWDHDTDYRPVIPFPVVPARPAAQAVVGLTVSSFVITSTDAGPSRPALLVRWDVSVDDIAGLQIEVRLASSGVVVSQPQTHSFASGSFVVSDGILPDVGYQVRAKYIPGVPRGVMWSEWIDVVSDDIRVGVGDFSDDVWEVLAEDAASVAAALDDDLVINEIQPLKREVDLRATEQRTVSEAVAMIGDQVLWVTTQLSEVDGKFADAGIVTDPETGKVRIYALEQEAERISEAEIRLSAAEASIALSATQAWVRGQITEALLDPSQLPLVEDLQLQVNAVEVELDAINADLALSASQTEVDGIGARLSTAEADLDAAQTAINLKAEQTQLETLQGRVQTAEVAISAFDGPQLTQTVADTRYLLAADEEAAEQTLASLLQAHADGERIRQDIAYATEDLRAKVTEDREAFAIRSVQIGASIDNAMALIEQESLARASQGEALAASLNTLTTTVGENTAKVQILSESVDGISGRHMLRVNVNDVVTGMVIAAEAGDDGEVSSSVAFAADSFTIAAPDGSSLTVPFSVFTVGRTIDGIYYPPGVYMEDIYVRRAIIGRADIHTANIAEGAITNNFAAFAGSDFYLSSSYQEVLAIDNVECSGNTMSLQANIQVDGASAIEIEVRVNGAPQRVFTVSAGIFMQQQSYPVGFTARGSTYVGEGGGWVNIAVSGTASAHIVPTPIFYADLKTIMMTVTPGEGTHRVSLHARLKAGSMSASAHVFNRFLQVEETKR